jgi:hypothetical protein
MGAMKRPKPIQGFKKLVTRRPVIDEVVRETTSGGVVFRRTKAGKVEILLIQDAKNRWTIPKGHVEPGEEPKATADEGEQLVGKGKLPLPPRSYIGLDDDAYISGGGAW